MAAPKPLPAHRRKLIAGAARNASKWKEELDRQITEAIREGASQEAVARAAGLSAPGVRKIAERTQEKT